MQRNTTRTGLARKQRHQRFAIRTWVDKLPDIPAFIIGNGPSLNDQPIDLLENYLTIGTNRCFKKIDPVILLWQDISLWTTEYHSLHNTQALKVSRDVSDPRKIYYNFHLKGGEFKFDTEHTHILYGRGSTGPLAVQLAVAMGCRPIVLLGMDCKLGENKETDFYGQNPSWTDSTIKNCFQGLVFIKEQCPVEVINCSNNTLWQQENLDVVLNTIDKKHKRTRQSYVRQILNLPEKNIDKY